MKVYAVKNYDGGSAYYEEFFTTEAAAQQWMDEKAPPDTRWDYDDWWIEEITVNGS